MDFSFSSEAEAFRDEVRAFLAANLTVYPTGDDALPHAVLNPRPPSSLCKLTTANLPDDGTLTRPAAHGPTPIQLTD